MHAIATPSLSADWFLHMIRSENVLAAYVVGNDLDEVAPVLRARFQAFLAEGRWPSSQAALIDQRHDPDPSFPDWPPDWDLGLNLGLDDLRPTRDWFASIKDLVEFLSEVHKETSREFVLFLCYKSRPWLQNELLSVGTA